MSRPNKPRRIADLAADLRAVIEYFHGFKISMNRGRIRAYLDTLDAAGRGEPVDRALLYSAVCEVSDLLEVTSLDVMALQPLRHRLKSICGGDAIFTATSGDDPGRNVCFELITGAMLQATGARSEFENPADVTTKVRGDLLLVECKRPTTLAALGRCLKKGYRQLSEHRRNGHRGFGAIALEVSVLVNPDAGVLVAKDVATAIEDLYRNIQRIFQESSEYLARAARDLRQDAEVHFLLFRVKCMTGDKEGANQNVAHVWHLEPTVEISSPEFQALYDFMKKQPGFTPGIWSMQHPGG